MKQYSSGKFRKTVFYNVFSGMSTTFGRIFDMLSLICADALVHPCVVKMARTKLKSNSQVYCTQKMHCAEKRGKCLMINACLLLDRYTER